MESVSVRYLLTRWFVRFAHLFDFLIPTNPCVKPNGHTSHEVYYIYGQTNFKESVWSLAKKKRSLIQECMN